MSEKRVSRIDFPGDRSRIQLGQYGVTVTVIPEHRTRLENAIAGGRRGSEHDLVLVVGGSKILADFKKHRVEPILFKDGKHLIRIARMRTIVESQGNGLWRKLGAHDF